MSVKKGGEGVAGLHEKTDTKEGDYTPLHTIVQYLMMLTINV